MAIILLHGYKKSTSLNRTLDSLYLFSLVWFSSHMQIIDKHIQIKTTFSSKQNNKYSKKMYSVIFISIVQRSWKVKHWGRANVSSK